MARAHVTPDGRRFVFTQYPDPDPPPLPNRIHVVEHWFEESKAKAGGER